MIISQYGVAFLFLLLVIGFSLILLFLPMVINRGKFYNNKLSPYECGVESVSNKKSKLNIKFFLVALLFLIFDLEIVILVPWVMNAVELGKYAYFASIFFIGLLFLAFFYEVRQGALDW